MSVASVIVEGKDDIVFLRRLIEVIRQQNGKGPLEWKLLNAFEKITIGAGVFGNCVCQNGGDTIAIFENRGVYQDVSPAALVLNLGKKSLKVTDVICLFDADAPTNFLGHPVNFGGFANRDAYVARKLSSLRCGHRHFLFPDNHSDGALEDLVFAIMTPVARSAFNPLWTSFRNGLQATMTGVGLQTFGYSPKGTVSQYASVLDEECAKDLYWVAALWNNAIWDWTSSALMPLTAFLQTAIPSAFA